MPLARATKSGTEMAVGTNGNRLLMPIQRDRRNSLSSVGLIIPYRPLCELREPDVSHDRPFGN